MRLSVTAAVAAFAIVSLYTAFSHVEAGYTLESVIERSGSKAKVADTAKSDGKEKSEETESKIKNFEQAKRVLNLVYRDLDKKTEGTKTVYCGCDIVFDSSGRWSPDLESCGYKVRKQKERASRIEVEHIMPAWEFGNQMKCWQEGGRKNCGRDKTFMMMEGDVHNLYPAVGEVNGDRSNFQFTDQNLKTGMYGKCEMVIDFKGRTAQPPAAARGIIARAYLYMADRYKIRLSAAQRRLYEAWNRMNPPDEFECLRNELLSEKAGHDNPFVTEKCKK